MATGSNVAYVAQKLLTSNVLNGLRGPAAVAASRILNTTFRRAYSRRCYHTNNSSSNNNNNTNGVDNRFIPAADDRKGLANVPNPPAAATDDSFYGFSDVFKHFSATTTDRLKWLFKTRSPYEYQFHSFHQKRYGVLDVFNRFTTTTTNRLTRVLSTPSTTLLRHPIHAAIHPEWDEVIVQFLWVDPESVKVFVINQDNATSIFMEAQGREKLELKRPGFKRYNSWFDLPDNHGYKINDFKAEIESMTGNLKLIFPKLKQEDEDKCEQQQTSIRNVKVDINHSPPRHRMIIYGKEYYC